MKQIEVIKPGIYDTFQCKGADCKRTCCTGWKITVGKAEYQDLKGKLNQAGAKVLRRLPEGSRSTQVYGEFLLEGKKGCPLQTKEGLCGLQLSLGPGALPDVCTYFPRRALRCGKEMQVSLTLACERVLELLLEEDKPLEFLRCKEPLPQVPARQISEKHGKPVWHQYLRLQEFCILLLQAEDCSLDHRMALLGLGLHQLDAYAQRNEPHKIAGYIEEYLSKLSQTEDIASLLPSSEWFQPILSLSSFLISPAASQGYRELVDRVRRELEISSRVDDEKKRAAITYSEEAYEQRKRLFQNFTDRHPYFLENIMVLLFVTGQWGMPRSSYSIWEQYLYACWVYSNLKFVLIACMKEDTTEEEILDICVILFRSWLHNEGTRKMAIQHFHDTESDTLAHMAMLVQAG